MDMECHMDYVELVWTCVWCAMWKFCILLQYKCSYQLLMTANN